MDLSTKYFIENGVEWVIVMNDVEVGSEGRPVKRLSAREEDVKVTVTKRNLTAGRSLHTQGDKRVE